MISIQNIDCMEYMKGLDNNAFDIALTSPPYNMNLRVNGKGNGYCSRQIIPHLTTKYANYGDNLPMEEYYKFLVSSVSETCRVSSMVFLNIQMITGNKPALFRFMGEFAEQIKEVIVWDKCTSQPAMCEGLMNSGYELIIVLGDKPIVRAFQNPNFQRGTLSNVMRIPKERSKDKTHGASFPLALADTILSNFGHEGQSVFDPFLGTGTSAVAAHNNSMAFTGCEIDTDYFNAAKARIKRDTSQIDMF